MTGVPPQEPLPWNRLKGESGKAYEAFMVYRDMGATRSARRTAAELQKAGSLIRRWRLQWRWDWRCAAWDDYLLQRRDDAIVEAVVTAPVHELAEMNQRHLAAATDFQQKCLLRLAQLDAQDITPANAWAWLLQAIALERAVALQLPEEPKGEEADQDTVLRILRDPTARALAAQLATHVNPNGQNGHGAD